MISDVIGVALMGAGLTGDPATLKSPGSPTIAVMADDLLSADSSG